MTQILNAGPMTPTFVKVRSHTVETPDTFTLRIDPPPNYHFKPGQFNMLYAFGVGESAISMSGDPEETADVVHTIRAVGSVTEALAKIRPGDQIGVRGPFGSSWPTGEALGKDVVIVSGGIGLAPLRPAIYQLLRHRADYGKISLLIGARTPVDLPYRAELEAWQQRADLQVLVTVDRGQADWQGRVGLVTTLFAQLEIDPARTIGMTCGPELMMRFVLREFSKRGVPTDQLYLSLERNMHCAIGSCGHCQFGPNFICMDGPVFRFDTIRSLFDVRDL